MVVILVVIFLVVKWQFRCTYLHHSKKNQLKLHPNCKTCDHQHVGCYCTGDVWYSVDELYNDYEIIGYEKVVKKEQVIEKYIDEVYKETISVESGQYSATNQNTIWIPNTIVNLLKFQLGMLLI